MRKLTSRLERLEARLPTPAEPEPVPTPEEIGARLEAHERAGWLVLTPAVAVGPACPEAQRYRMGSIVYLLRLVARAHSGECA